jgi:KDO2-lipid IV(A) lauroyltransferase
MRRNDILYLLLVLARRVVPVVPLGTAYALASAVATAAYYLLPGPRRTIRANLAQVVGAAPSSPEVARLARSAFRNDARNWIDTVRLHRLTPGEILCSVPIVEGWEHIEQAAERSRGLILVTLHLGNTDLVGQLLVARGYQLTVPVERVQPARLFDLLQRERQSKGIDTVPVHGAAPALLRALRAGQIVAVAGDRSVAGRTGRAAVFGRDASLPLGPLALARHTGAPVILGVGARVGPGRYRGYVTPPLPLQHTGNARDDERHYLEVLAATMEPFIARFPDQWLMFTPFWTDGGNEKAAATIGHPREAAI